MRLNNFLLLLTLLLVPLSGCLGFGDEENGDDESDDHDHSTHDHGDGNMTDDHMDDDHMDGNDTEVPNVLPNATLIMTADVDGRVLSDTDYILPGQNITFSAVGSQDPDGEIDLIGLTVKDANETRTVQLLDAAGNFVNVSMQFAHEGPVNVTLRVLDNRGEGIQLTTSAAVNTVESRTSDGENLYLPDQSGCSPDTSAGGTILINQQFYEDEGLNVNPGAKWFSIEATGTDHVSICGPDDEPIASGETSASTDEGEWLSGPNNYYVAVFPSGPATEMTFTVIVHYESKPAA